MFYGGIAGAVIFTLLLFILWGIFEKKKKDLKRKIEDEY